MTDQITTREMKKKLLKERKKFLKQINKVKDSTMPEFIWSCLYDKVKDNIPSEDQDDAYVGRALRKASNEDFADMLFPID